MNLLIKSQLLCQLSYGGSEPIVSLRGSELKDADGAYSGNGWSLVSRANSSVTTPIRNTTDIDIPA